MTSIRNALSHRALAITFALFLLTGTIVEAQEETKCRELRGLLRGLEDIPHTVLKGYPLEAFVTWLEGQGATFEEKPDYAIRVDLAERQLTLLAFGNGDKVCSFYAVPLPVARQIVSGA